MKVRFPPLLESRQPRPTVILISHFCPYPSTHGNRSRLVSWLAWLRAHGFRVRYILQVLDLEEESALRDLADAVDRLDVIRSPFQGPGLRLSVRRVAGRMVRRMLPKASADTLRRLFDHSSSSGPRVIREWATRELTEDPHIDRWCWPTTREIVRRAIDEEHPVAVITEYALLSRCLEDVPAPALKIIDTTEVFFRNADRFRVEGLDAPLICTPDSEKMALGRADVIVAIQKNDAAALRELFPQKRVITVGHTYPWADRRFREPESGLVLYVGSSNPFNVHGLRCFLTQAWPQILATAPQTRLRIVGSCPRVEAAADTRVTYVGRVSDERLVQEYRRARVVINPQVAGTGLKIKCVEALSAGCPLVVNGAGADGLEDYAGQAFLLATNWTQFAQHVLRLLTDDALAQRLQAEATRLAEEMFSEGATFSELALILKPLLPQG
jgi:glycosyltransferase involved in cell wall biosynthesis